MGSGGAGTREHLPLPRKRTTKILCLVQPRLQLPLPGSAPPSRLVGPSDSRPATILDKWRLLLAPQPSYRLGTSISLTINNRGGGRAGDRRQPPFLARLHLSAGSTWGEEASRAGAPSWDGVNTALNVVFLYYTRSYTVLCAHFSLIILNIL